jgi:hypothetical protein
VLATTQRQSATTKAWQSAEPLMVTAQAVDTSLSDADTTAAASFLQGRVAPAALQARYQQDLTSAAADIAQAARTGGGDPAVAGSLQTLSTDLPLYAGIIQEADFNERQGSYPLAAAYLAEANNLMRSSILPAAARVYGTEVDRLASDQTTAVSPWLVGLAGLFLLALLVALAVAQQRLRRHFHRTWNVALAAATIIVVLVGVWATVALVTQNSGVTNAQSDARQVSAFTDARILALRARADDELTLLTRDSDPSYQADYRSTAAALSHLLNASDTATGSAASFDAAQTAQASAAFESYAALHRQLRADDVAFGNLGGAVKLASGSGANQLPAVSSTLDDALSQGINGSQTTFVSAASGAGSDLNGLTWGFVVAAIVVAILVLVGFQPRIAEYR